MMIYYLFFFYLLLISIFMFLMSLYFLISKFLFYIDLEILKIVSVKIEFLILIDWISLMFISVVMVISCMIILYSVEYMEGDFYKFRFIYLIILFIVSMILMILSPNMISILLGWDGLGLISYCLVIYYQNENSFNSGMVTVLTNRLGDILILMMISLLTYMGSWNFMFYNHLDYYFLLMIFLASITKSAQIPFSFWLPMAMSAPTPVSSLVHSSTLVTAGVFLLIRYNYLFLMNLKLLRLMMLISVFTMLMSGIAANFENDFKKIIAFSTLSQLGVMIFCLSIKLPEISLFHLLIHAMFKSMLFMSAGVVIHNMLSNQDIRYISMVFYNMPLISMFFNCSSISLCGLPFMSGFFSKDLILEMFLMSKFNQMIFFILFFSMGLTVSYSIRLLYYSFLKFSNIMNFFKFKSLSSLMSYSMIFLFFMVIIKGLLLNWIIFSNKNFIFLTMNLKLAIYLFMILGGCLGWMLSLNFFMKLITLNMNNLFNFFLLMWYLPLFYNIKLFNFFNLMQKNYYLVELGWNEYLLSGGLIMFFKKNFFYDLFDKNYLYLLILMMYLILMLMVF